jgi:predicted nucleotidyltransferase
LWPRLSDRPRADEFQSYVERVLAAKGDQIEFIVLYGSMARGNWDRHSDYDLLIGLCGEDGMRFIDRLREFDQYDPGPVESFVYSRAEWEKMWRQLHLTLLECADYGMPLFDRGGWAAIQAEFARYVRDGVVEKLEGGWRKFPERISGPTDAIGAAGARS